MTTEQSATPTRPPGPPPQVRSAGWIVGAQGLVGVGFAVVLATFAGGAETGPASVLAEAGFFVLIGAALVGVGRGLVRGRRWARTPAIVVQLLLLPAVYSLLGSHRFLLGAGAGAVVIATFLLLISERSRAWSMGLGPWEARR